MRPLDVPSPPKHPQGVLSDGDDGTGLGEAVQLGLKVDSGAMLHRRRVLRGRLRVYQTLPDVRNEDAIVGVGLADAQRPPDVPPRGADKGDEGRVGVGGMAASADLAWPRALADEDETGSGVAEAGDEAPGARADRAALTQTRELPGGPERSGGGQS